MPTRVDRGRRLLGLIKASTATGAVCCLLGRLQVVFAFPSHACPDYLEMRPTVHVDRYADGVFPLQATCYWDNGEQKELVSSWINPLLFTCMAVVTSCLVMLAARTYRRCRQGHTR
ncbi:hypothetical protein ABZX69_06920 [Streptomyces sp. NPDC004074]|uniref:hypothetical protein n=1 Tax=Streptomyces sp. NPDC004074 TaxID=3154277 RepID=UPI0033AB9B5A